MVLVHPGADLVPFEHVKQLSAAALEHEKVKADTMTSI
jgi:hypothetical protein